MVVTQRFTTVQPDRVLLRPLTPRRMPGPMVVASTAGPAIGAGAIALPRPFTTISPELAERLNWVHRRATVPYWIVAVTLSSTIAGSTALGLGLASRQQTVASAGLPAAAVASGAVSSGLGSAGLAGSGLEASQQVASLRQELQQLASDLERAQRDNTLLRSDSRGQAGELEEIQSQYVAAEQWRQANEAELAALQGRYVELQGEMDAELAAVQARLAALEQAVRSAEKLANDLRALLGMPQAAAPASLGMGGDPQAVASGEADPWAIAQAEIGSLADRVAALEANLFGVSARAQATIARLQSAGIPTSGDLTRDLAFMPNAPLGMPVDGPLTSSFGMRMDPFTESVPQFHSGIDLAVPEGTPVRATGAGTVLFAGWNGGYGNLVIIDHGRGVTSYYGHNARLTVATGQRVDRGDVVALAGTTGYSTGSHVHYEVRRGETPIDPLPLTRIQP